MMRSLKASILLMIIGFLFLGSVGFNVFLHTCKEDGTFVSYFVEAEDHCEGMHSELPVCCQQQQERKDCCDDEIQYVQLKLDFFQDLQVHWALSEGEEEIRPVFAWVTPADEEHVDFNGYANPPPLSGREILLNNQIWQI